MLRKIKNPEGIKIEFTQHQKKIREINFVFDDSFYYDFETKKLSIDINPYEEPLLIEVNKINEGYDNGELALYIETVGDERVSLHSNSVLDSIIINSFVSVYNGRMDVSGDYTDDFSIVFERGVFKQLSIVKWDENKIINSVSLYRNEVGTFLIKNSPWQKMLISKFDILHSEMFILTEYGSEVYSMNVPLFIERVLKELSLFVLGSAFGK